MRSILKRIWLALRNRFRQPDLSAMTEEEREEHEWFRAIK